MKKVIVGSVILLAVAGVCVPFVNGLVMEKIVKRTQHDLNEMYADTGSGVTIDIMKYDRNFSSSEIEWSIKLGSLAAVYGVDEILLVDRADHGFTGVVAKTSLEKNQWFIDLLNDELEGNNPLTITTRYNVWGKIESIIDIDAFSFQLDNETVNVRPGRIVTLCGEGLTHLASEANWEGLSVSDKLRVDRFSMVYDLEKISTYIWDGEISYQIKNITLKENEENFELMDFRGKYTLDFDHNTNMLSTGGEVEIDNLVAKNEKVQDTIVRLSVNNINAHGYEEFMKAYTQTMHSVLEDIKTAEGNPQQMENVMENQMATTSLQMMAAYEKFLKKGLEIKISDFHARLPEGEVTGNLELILNQDVTFAQLVPIAMQPNLAFTIISLQSDLRFPAVLARDKPMFISPVYPGMQTGLFVEDGDNLVHSAQTKNGKLILNGSEVVFN